MNINRLEKVEVIVLPLFALDEELEIICEETRFSCFQDSETIDIENLFLRRLILLIRLPVSKPFLSEG